MPDGPTTARRVDYTFDEFQKRGPSTSERFGEEGSQRRYGKIRSAVFPASGYRLTVYTPASSSRSTSSRLLEAFNSAAAAEQEQCCELVVRFFSGVPAAVKLSWDVLHSSEIRSS